MGFLDGQQRIIDMVITDEGRRQFSLGELRFVYYSFSDDGIDYKPIIMNSGSMNSMQLSSSRIEQTEAYIGHEAVCGLSRLKALHNIDTVNINNKLFTMPQGQKYLPRATFDPLVDSGSIQIDQQKLEEISIKKDENGKVMSQIGPIDNGFKRDHSSTFTVDLDVDDYFPDFMQEGFSVQVLLSGSDGLINIESKRDSNEDDCFGSELRMLFDGKFRKLDERAKRK